MKFALSWLKEYLTTDATLEQITDTLTRIGLEVEGIEKHGEALANFITAKILAAKPHQDADRLQICTVDNGTQELQIVCGAPNARAGLYVALAQVGTLIPAGNFKIKQSKIRGVESCGMLCSAAELGLGENSAGIMELPECELGQPIAPVLGIDDTIIDVGLTPNRGDCFAVYGIARDLAAAGLGVLKTISIPDFTAPKADLVTLETPLCPAFAALKIENVQNAAAPNWMQSRLKSAGKTPRGLLIDVTNYSTFAFARPLHSFDAEKVQGRLVVHEAIGGEAFLGLDDVEYKLPKGAIVISDDSGIISLAGIMGGKSTAVTDETQHIILESAVFDAGRIALTAQKLNIHTDARQRFERGIDAAFTVNGLALAATEVGGKMTSYQLAGSLEQPTKTMPFDRSALERLSGIQLSDQEIDNILTALGFTIENNQLIAPSWRHDMTGPFAAGDADWAEEVLRIKGYDQIPIASLPVKQRSIQKVTSLEHARKTLCNQHFQEVLSYSFLSPKFADLFQGDKKRTEISNPISQDLSVMRPSLLPNLLEAQIRNQQEYGKLFEIGSIFDGMEQSETAAGILWGINHPEHWRERPRTVNAFDAKAAALNILQCYGLEEATLQTSPENLPGYYHPGQSGHLMLGAKNNLATFGMLHPAVAKELDIEQPIALFEINLEAIPQRQQKNKAFIEQKLQCVQRDLAFVVANDVPAEQLLKLAQGADKKHITNVKLFDVYSGKGMETDKKSLAIRLTLQPQQQTFTDSDINNIMDKVITQVAKKTGGVLRG